MNKPLKAFVASRVSGEDRETLLAFLRGVDAALRASGIEPYITELSPPQSDEIPKLVRAFRHIAESDVLIVIYKPGPTSEGMSAEIGYAFRHKPVWVFAQAGTHSSLFGLAKKMEYWENEQDLLHKLKEMK